MKKVVLFTFLIALAGSAKAQRTCATTDIEQLNKTPEQVELKRASFENWLQQKRASLLNSNALQEQSATTIYTIPVVVHIIHNGEAYGEGLNVTDEQVASQIEVLNKDFRHLNADSVNTPSIFQQVMADVGIEFKLAKRTPTGLPTSGITRTNGVKTNWTRFELDELKSLSYWSSTDYLNIWVAPSNEFLGWAQFPTSDIIDGVNNQTTGNPVTDGVVISTTAFGSVEIYPQGNYQPSFALGRTTTHEIGHFFGLRHIWGDGGCGIDDFVSDTPIAEDSYLYCPDFGPTSTTCGSQDMFMNYMDYVDDDCMNLFSLGQKDRMLIVLNNSPRRASLLTSPALDPPPLFDVAITEILSPNNSICDAVVAPVIEIYNTGLSDITEIDLSILVNQIEVAQQVFTINLVSEQKTILSLPTFTFAEFGNQSLVVQINSANNRQDDNPSNDSFSKTIFNIETVASLDEQFTSWPASWAIRTSAPVSNWNFQQAPNLEIGNTAAALNYFRVSSAFEDQLITPTLDLTGYTNPMLIFNHAYGERTGYNDVLAVLISADCGTSFQDTLFLKSGADLATTQMPVSFTPSGPIDWQTNILDLSNYQSEYVQLAFIGKTDGGNNIYLDNFKLVDYSYEDISLVSMVNESGAFYSSIATIGLVIENSGTTTVNSFEIEAFNDNGSVGTQLFSNVNLLPGERQVIQFNNIFTSGMHTLQFKVLLPDANEDNNILTTSANFLSASEVIPFREKFNDGTWNETNNWTITSPSDILNWQIWPQNEQFLAYQSSLSGNVGLHNWLVLPLVDFSQTNLASLQFAVAYAGNNSNNDMLRIWLSTNEGASFDYLLDTQYGNVLSSSADTDNTWAPATKDDWEINFIDLSDFSGEDKILIGFEAIDGDGYNIYLDNIDFFVTNELVDIEIDDNELAIYPNPVTNLEAKITFNLEQKQEVRVRIIDLQGNQVSDQIFTNVLNQTYPLELSTQMNGIYIIQTIGVDFSKVTRILVSK